MFAAVKITHIPPNILHLQRMVGRHHCTDAVNVRMQPSTDAAQLKTSIEGFRKEGLKYFQQLGQISNP